MSDSEHRIDNYNFLNKLRVYRGVGNPIASYPSMKYELRKSELMAMFLNKVTVKDVKEIKELFDYCPYSYGEIIDICLYRIKTFYSGEENKKDLFMERLVLKNAFEAMKTI